MSTIVHTKTNISNGTPGTAWMALWTPLTSTNAVGDACEMAQWADRSVHVKGTFGSATVVIQGSHDGVTWVSLTDPQGNAISKTSEFIEQIEEITRYIRPSTSGGDGTQSLSVYLLLTGFHGY